MERLIHYYGYVWAVNKAESELSTLCKLCIIKAFELRW